MKRQTLFALLLLVTHGITACGDEGSKLRPSQDVSSPHVDHSRMDDVTIGVEEADGHDAKAYQSGDGGHSHGSPHAEESGHIEMDSATAQTYGIKIARAKSDPVVRSVKLPAELRFDADRVAGVSPLVSGRVTRVFVSEGDMVRKGHALALLSSRELADLKAQYLTAQSSESLARRALEREEALFADKITAEADLIAARATLASAEAVRTGVENKLHAVGISDAQLASLPTAEDGALANTRLLAPIDGVIARRTATLGSAVSADDASAPSLFTIIDDSVLWADVAVYKQDASLVQAGSRTVLFSESEVRLAEGKIATVLPAFDEASRTATARLVIDNSDRRLRPGQFVVAEVFQDGGTDAVQVPSASIVDVDNRPSLFVPTPDGFEARPIIPGPSRSGRTVILSGLEEGERFVSDGAFTLKAQLEKDAFGDGHEH